MQKLDRACRSAPGSPGTEPQRWAGQGLPLRGRILGQGEDRDRGGCVFHTISAFLGSLWFRTRTLHGALVRRGLGSCLRPGADVFLGEDITVHLSPPCHEVPGVVISRQVVSCRGPVLCVFWSFGWLPEPSQGVHTQACVGSLAISPLACFPGASSGCRSWSLLCHDVPLSSTCWMASLTTVLPAVLSQMSPQVAVDTWKPICVPVVQGGGGLSPACLSGSGDTQASPGSLGPCPMSSVYGSRTHCHQVRTVTPQTPSCPVHHGCLPPCSDAC